MRSRVRQLAVATASLAVLSQGLAGADAAHPPWAECPSHQRRPRIRRGPTRLRIWRLTPGTARGGRRLIIDFRTARCGLVRSTDGGQTSKPHPNAARHRLVPLRRVDASETVILHSPSPSAGTTPSTTPCWGWDTQDGGGGRLNTNVLLARSNDLGDTWETTMVRNNRGKTDKKVENSRPVHQHCRRHQERQC